MQTSAPCPVAHRVVPTHPALVDLLPWEQPYATFLEQFQVYPAQHSGQRAGTKRGHHRGLHHLLQRQVEARSTGVSGLFCPFCSVKRACPMTAPCLQPSPVPVVRVRVPQVVPRGINKCVHGIGFSPCCCLTPEQERRRKALFRLSDELGKNSRVQSGHKDI